MQGARLDLGLDFLAATAVDLAVRFALGAGVMLLDFLITGPVPGGACGR